MPGTVLLFFVPNILLVAFMVSHSSHAQPSINADVFVSQGQGKRDFSYHVIGQVNDQTGDLSGIAIRAVGLDANGLVVAIAKPDSTDNNGSFDIHLRIDQVILAQPDLEISIIKLYAHRDINAPPIAQYELRVGGRNKSELIFVGHEQIQPRSFLSIIILVVSSLLLGLCTFRGSRNASVVSYYLLVVNTCTLAVTMLITIGSGLIFAEDRGQKNTITSMGVFYLYSGKYLANLNPEWTISLTYPTKPLAPLGKSGAKSNKPVTGKTSGANQAQASSGSVASAQDVAASEGFGAPLWVVMMSVVGSTLLTLTYIVLQVRNPVSFANDTVPHTTNPDGCSICERKEALLRHQLYTLCSPLGAIFIYQLLLVAEAASQYGTVATVAMAGGMGMNLILDKGIQKVKEMVDVNRPKPGSSTSNEKVDSAEANDANKDE